MIRKSEPCDLIEGAFFIQLSSNASNAVAETLVQQCETRTFPILYQVFPDYARNMNDHYCVHGFNFLLHLHEKVQTVDWLPSWIRAKKGDLGTAIKHYVRSCLTYFASDALRSSILLCAAALRRVFKIRMVVDDNLWRIGEVMHFFERYENPETDWE